MTPHRDLLAGERPTFWGQLIRAGCAAARALARSALHCSTRARIADGRRRALGEAIEGDQVQDARACGVRIVAGPVSAVQYRFELRRGDEVVATGHVTRDEPIEIGDRVVVGGREGIARSVEPILGELELRLVVQLVRDEA